MDLGASKENRDTFYKILLEANFQFKAPLFTGEELHKIEELLKGDLKKQSPIAVFGEYLDKINTALASEKGKEILDKKYEKYVTSKAKHIDSIINCIKHPAAKKYYSSNEGRALLLDYNNQYGLSSDGPFTKYMNGEAVKMFTGKILHISEGSSYNFKNHEEFVKNLKYYNSPASGRPDQARHDVERQFINVLDCVREYDKSNKERLASVTHSSSSSLSSSSSSSSSSMSSSNFSTDSISYPSNISLTDLSALLVLHSDGRQFIVSAHGPLSVRVEGCNINVAPYTQTALPAYFLKDTLPQSYSSVSSGSLAPSLLSSFSFSSTSEVSSPASGRGMI